MRLEYKVGIVVAVAVVALGAWFFATRDQSASTPLADKTSTPKTEPGTPAGTAKPVAVTTPRPPAQPTMAPPLSPARTITMSDPPRVSADATTRPSAPSGTLSLVPDHSPLPGIRSETPLPGSESPGRLPSADPLTRSTPPAMRPSRLSLPPLPPPVTIAPTMSPAAHEFAPTPREAPAVPALSTAADGTRVHVMKAGDTIQGLAVKYLGSAKHASLILDANKQFADPRRIPIGAKITIPPAPQASPEAPKVAAKDGPTTRPSLTARTPSRRQPPNTRPYVVKKNDTWRKLAAQYYGSESEWPQLFEMNKRSPGDTSHTLRVGETIYVPATSTAAPTPAPAGSPAPPIRTLIGTTPR